MTGDALHSARADGRKERILFNGTGKRKDVHIQNGLVQVAAMSHYASRSAYQNGHKSDFYQDRGGLRQDSRRALQHLGLGRAPDSAPPNIKTVAEVDVTDQTRIDKLMAEVLDCTKNGWG